MKTIAIIPARGGSKRLPRKNILPVLGKPIITYPIQTAQKSGLFDEIFVSTEDSEIREIASSTGANVIERPAELAQDRSTVVHVCKHLLDQLSEKHIVPNCFCCIYPTALLINTDDLNNSFKVLHKEPYPDAVMGVSEYNLHPVQALIEKNNFLSPKWLEYIGIQSQFLPELVGSNGTFYWVRTKAFRKEYSFYLDRLKGYLIPKYRAIDIDTEEDFKFAKFIAEHLQM